MAIGRGECIRCNAESVKSTEDSKRTGRAEISANSRYLTRRSFATGQHHDGLGSPWTSTRDRATRHEPAAYLRPHVATVPTAAQIYNLL